MALVKVKPTSPGRRAVVKIVKSRFAQGRTLRQTGRKTDAYSPGATIMATLLLVTWEEVISSIIVLSISVGIKMASLPRSSDWNTIRIAAPIWRCFVMPMGSDATLSPQRDCDAGMQLMSGADAPIKNGNTLPLRNIPVGSTIHCVEMMPGKGAQLARSAGTSVQLLAREGDYAQLRLRSGEIRKVHVNCRATIGEVGNEEHNLQSIGKAGAQRWRGIRPTVRGVVMNPVDHPHGGGEGKTAAGRHPVSPWGTPAKGFRTRTNKRTDGMIVRRRYSTKG